jgi:hypothetical protein
VFTTLRARAGKAQFAVTLDLATLGRWGMLRVPGAVWRAMTRLGAWIEPVLVSEWVRLIRTYAARMGMDIPPGQAEAALVWEEPMRDTTFGRLAAARLADAGEPVTCIWSGGRLTQLRLDIDHCLPWSAWPCGDLWNLMPSDRRINQHQKRDRLPAAATLLGAKSRILQWWERAWLADPGLQRRFAEEAAAALPATNPQDPEDVFAALEWRRLRLSQDQHVPEWVH